MRFRYRLGYYMSGFAIGLFFVAMVWSGKDARCNYFPNARVLDNFRTKPFQFSDEARKQFTEGWVDSMDVVNTLWHGDVVFDESNVPFQGGKKYIVEGETSKKLPIKLEIINYDEKAVLKSVLKK